MDTTSRENMRIVQRAAIGSGKGYVFMAIVPWFGPPLDLNAAYHLSQFLRWLELLDDAGILIDHFGFVMTAWRAVVLAQAVRSEDRREACGYAVQLRNLAKEVLWWEAFDNLEKIVDVLRQEDQ